MRIFIDMNKGGGVVMTFLQTNTILIGDIVSEPYILEIYPFNFLAGRRWRRNKNK